MYSDDSDDCSEEEDREPVEMIKTKPICDKESGKEMSQGAGAAPEEAKEPKELEWRLAYAGSETSTEIRHLAPATQYQVRNIMSSWCQKNFDLKSSNLDFGGLCQGLDCARKCKKKRKRLTFGVSVYT